MSVLSPELIIIIITGYLLIISSLIIDQLIKLKLLKQAKCWSLSHIGFNFII